MRGLKFTLLLFVLAGLGSCGSSAAPRRELTIATKSLEPGQQGKPYSQQLQASGGIEPYFWSVPRGSLPSGISLSGSGLLSGTPARSGHFSFVVEVEDSSPAAQTAIAKLNLGT